MQPCLEVRSHAGMAAIDQFANQIDALNSASARPNPFYSSSYLRCFAQTNEYMPDMAETRLYTVFQNGQFIGCMPLRRVRDRVGPLHSWRVCFWVPFDVERPGILCEPKNEERVGQAIIDHLCEKEACFGMLELVGQPTNSVLYRLMHAAGNARFRARDIEADAISEIAVTWPDVASYTQSLSASWRRNLARSARLLQEAGTVEVVLVEGVPACMAWFDAYLELESRSWKRNTSAAIVRNERRVAFYQQFVAGHAGFEPSFIGVVLDGFLVAGTLNGSNTDAPRHARGVWGLEMAYDDAYSGMGPGVLLYPFLVHVAIQRNEKFVNLLHGFSDYKRRWKADVIAVKNVQLIRRHSLHNLKAIAGETIRKLQSKFLPMLRKANRQATTSPAPKAGPHTFAAPDRTLAKATTATALAYDGSGVSRLNFAQLSALLSIA